MPVHICRRTSCLLHEKGSPAITKHNIRGEKSTISTIIDKETILLLENSSCSYLQSSRPETLHINTVWILYYVYPLLPKLKPGTESVTKDLL